MKNNEENRPTDPRITSLGLFAAAVIIICALALLVAVVATLIRWILGL